MSSDSSSSSKISDLEDYLSGQEDYELTIPSEYLESGMTYELGCWFKVAGENISSTHELPPIPLYPPIEV